MKERKRGTAFEKLKKTLDLVHMSGTSKKIKMNKKMKTVEERQDKRLAIQFNPITK